MTTPRSAHPLAFAADVADLSPVHVYAYIKGVGDAEHLSDPDEADHTRWKYFGARDRRHMDAAIHAGYVTSDGKRLTSVGEQLHDMYLSYLPTFGRANDWRAHDMLRAAGLPDGDDYMPPSPR